MAVWQDSGLDLSVASNVGAPQYHICSEQWCDRPLAVRVQKCWSSMRSLVDLVRDPSQDWWMGERYLLHSIAHGMLCENKYVTK